MANMLENYGLGYLAEEDDTFMGLVSHVAREGKALCGYYDVPYFYLYTGDSEFWLKTQRRSDGNLEVTGLDTHAGNFCVWDMVHTGIDLTPKDAPPMSHVAMFHPSETSGGLLPVELITADVLPSLMKDDKIQMQMVALPLDISYYADEDEYAEACPEDEDGHKWLMAMGSMAPVMFLYNHEPSRYEEGKEYESDRYVQFTATVKAVSNGVFEMNGEKHKTYIRCLADTKYGELEFNHALDQVPEEQRKNIRAGAVISGTCILSGDAAIYAYEQGIVKDFEHNLKLLRYTLVKGDPERMRSVLAENAVYESELSGKEYVGPQEIIYWFRYVHENRDNEHSAHFATITEVDEEVLEFPVGTRCIALAPGEEKDYEALVFLTVDADGMISRIEFSTDSRYHFKVDEPYKVKTPLDDYEIPNSVAEPIILRAKFLGLIDAEATEEYVIKGIDNYAELEQNAQRMLDALQKNPQPDVEVALENIMGYLFAKAVEQTVNERKAAKDPGFRLAASFSPADAFDGKLSTMLSSGEHVALERAMRRAKQFFTDVKTYAMLTEVEEDNFPGLYKEAAIVVQRLGQLYASLSDEKKEKEATKCRSISIP